METIKLGKKIESKMENSGNLGEYDRHSGNSNDRRCKMVKNDHEGDGITMTARTSSMMASLYIYVCVCARARACGCECICAYCVRVCMCVYRESIHKNSASL